MKQYYAKSHPYGKSALNTNGAQADQIVRFSTVEERDSWINKDPEKRSYLSPGKVTAAQKEHLDRMGN